MRRSELFEGRKEEKEECTRWTCQRRSWSGDPRLILPQHPLRPGPKGAGPGAPGSGFQRLDQGLIGTEALEACFHRAIKPLKGKTGNARDGCTGSGVVVLPENGGDPQVRLLLVGATAPPVVIAPQQQRNEATAMLQERTDGFLLVSCETASLCAERLDARHLEKEKEKDDVMLVPLSNFDPMWCRSPYSSDSVWLAGKAGIRRKVRHRPICSERGIYTDNKEGMKLGDRCESVLPVQ